MKNRTWEEVSVLYLTWTDKMRTWVDRDKLHIYKMVSNLIARMTNKEIMKRICFKMLSIYQTAIIKDIQVTQKHARKWKYWRKKKQRE
jgi:hypothetical protein